MFVEKRTSKGISRRAFSIGLGLVALRPTAGWQANATETQTPADRFDYLSTHGNSNCSAAFLDSIRAGAVSASPVGWHA